MDAEEITIDYWTRSAKGYKKHIQESFGNEEEEMWLRYLLSHAPEKECLKVLDIGTGPGFFAIILSRAGHDCIGIDATEAMVEAARDNAEQQGVKAEFFLMNADDLDFPDGTFDLIVNRNVTWTLPDMEECYREWRRVLAPNGVVLVIDANYYRNQFDRALELEYLRLMRHDILEGRLHDDDRDDFHIRAEYWETRPMAGTDRPKWDANVLKKLRFVDITAMDKVPELSKPGFKSTYQLTEYFSVSARKPSPGEYDRVFLDEYWGGISGCMSAHSAMALENGSAQAYVRALGIPEGSKVLDIGCGGGAVTEALGREGFDASGIDSNKLAIELAGLNMSEGKLIEGDAADLPFEDGAFDAAVMRNVVWCLHEPEKALNEAFRVIRKGGCLIITDGQWKKVLRSVSAGEMPMHARRDLGFGGISVAEDIMSRLPLTEIIRPEWDLDVLSGLGMTVSACRFKDPMMPPEAKALSGIGFMIRAAKRFRCGIAAPVYSSEPVIRADAAGFLCEAEQGPEMYPGKPAESSVPDRRIRSGRSFSPDRGFDLVDFAFESLEFGQLIAQIFFVSRVQNASVGRRGDDAVFLQEAQEIPYFMAGHIERLRQFDDADRLVRLYRADHAEHAGQLVQFLVDLESHLAGGHHFLLVVNARRK